MSNARASALTVLPSNRFLSEHRRLVDLAAEMADDRPLTSRANSNLRLLCHFKRVVHLNAEVADDAFELRVSQQELNGPEVLRPSVYERRLRAPD